MTVYYLDSSAWQKYYLRETGSEEVAKLFTSTNILACSAVGFIEIASILWQKVVSQAATKEQFKQKMHDLGSDWTQFAQIHLTPRSFALASQAMISFEVYDNRALHAGAVLMLQRMCSANGNPMTVVSTDNGLLTIARKLGCSTMNPNESPNS